MLSTVTAMDDVEDSSPMFSLSPLLGIVEVSTGITQVVSGTNGSMCQLKKPCRSRDTALAAWAVSCCDSRADPAIVFDADPGDMFCPIQKSKKAS